MSSGRADILEKAVNKCYRNKKGPDKYEIFTK
jgi:hypothetical protein